MADSTRLSKNASGGRYKYADMSQIHGWLEENNISYYQYTELIEGNDYIYTVPIIDGKELPARRGCRVVDATLVGVNNPAQVQGSAITYARRYSLLMAFGLCTEDDDAQSQSKPKEEKKAEPKKEEKKEEVEKAPNPNLISPEEKAQIFSEMARTHVSTEQICKMFEVEVIDDLPKKAFPILMKKLKATPDFMR